METSNIVINVLAPWCLYIAGGTVSAGQDETTFYRS